MILANRLQRGDTIGIIAPSGPCNEQKLKELEKLIEYLEGLDINVQLAENFMKTDRFQTSGWTAQERAQDFNAMAQGTWTQAIWCLQWGDTINQIIDFIDYEALKENPKIIIGKSDIDVLHNAVYKKTWLVTFHGPDSKIGSKGEMELAYTQECFEKRLFEGYVFIEASQENQRYSIVSGKASGTLIGCNLTSILKLAGTQYFPDFTKNFIFFMETYKDNPKGLIAKLTQLKMLWVFEQCKWIVIGSNYGFDETNATAEEVIGDFIAGYNIPLMKTNEFGHYQPHAFLPIGAEVSIDTESWEIKILHDFLK